MKNRFPRPSRLHHLASMGLLMASPLFADVRLPAIFSDHMVLQRADHAPVWGAANPGENVTVSLHGRTASAQAGPDGRWRVDLDTSTLGDGPQQLVVEGTNRVVIDDVLIGEVWLASGQSNMELTLAVTTGAREEMSRPEDNRLREFAVTKNPSEKPQDWGEGQWRIARPDTVGKFSAVGYYFGRTLRRELNAPVGIISAAFGGTCAEAWVSPEAVARDPLLQTDAAQKLEIMRHRPARVASYQQDLRAWLKENHREDTEIDLAAGQPQPLSVGDWHELKVPNSLTQAGIPTGGSVWLRKQVSLRETMEGKPLRLELGPIPGLVAVYWDGTAIGRITAETAGRQMGGLFQVPAAKATAGAHELLVRIFSPTGRESFTPVRVTADLNHSVYFTGNWEARVGYQLPALPAAAAKQPQPPAAAQAPQNQTSWLFNGMIHPLVPFGIKGVIWYQGESNETRAYRYRTLFAMLINDWRAAWQKSPLPFYYCQLASFRAPATEPGESRWAVVRESQAHVLSLPNTGQAVLIDVGEEGDIHPRDKHTPGDRLARISLAKTYGKPLAYQGPVYAGMKIEESRIRVQFQPSGDGLVAKPLPADYQPRSTEPVTKPQVRNSPASAVEGFAICGEDRRWVWADARIENDSVAVWSAKIPHPVAVRYAWSDNPPCNLYNREGLPAMPFRTDNFPVVTESGESGSTNDN